VNFSGEEQGMFGSEAYADRARAKGEDIVGVINLDMLGWDDTGGPDIDLHAGTDVTSLALAQAFSEAVALYGLDLVPQIIDVGAVETSDHGPFWDNGYAAILAIEDYHPDGEDFNPCYHSPAECDDLLEHMNLDYFTAFTQAALATLATLAEPVVASTPTATPIASSPYIVAVPYVSVGEDSGGLSLVR
jgi:Zn-dependent M28 family amino/carboxypeptidase